MNIKKICPICKKEKPDVGPKIFRYTFEIVPPFTNKILTGKTTVMCGDCLAEVKAGKTEIVEKS